jgi:superfamily I DNA/RNA helicase
MKFDVPVLRRLAAGTDGVETLAFYDTFPLVRSLSQDSPKQEDIAHRFGIDCGRAHHALDDAITLAHVYRELQKLRAARARKAVLSNVLDYLGLALALENRETSKERELLFNLGRYRTLGRYSDALEFYAASRTDNTPILQDVIARLGGQALMTKLRAARDPSQRYAAAVARLNALIGEGTLDECIDLLLERVALSTSEGVELAPDRVNLLTLHSTKGLEFSRVYILGVEDYEFPGYQATTAELEEARRLLYVGMTRAKDRLVFTHVARRKGEPTGGHRFLDEMGIAPSPA